MVYQQRFSCLPHRPFRSDPDYSSFRHQDLTKHMVSLCTPHRASARVQQDHRVKAQYDVLQREFRGCYVDGLKIDDFITSVLRLPEDTLAAIRTTENQWKFAPALVNEYLAECDKPGNNEHKLYPKFTRLTHRALDAVTKHVKNVVHQDDPRLRRLFERQGTVKITSQDTVRKPDAWLYRAPLADEDKPIWELVQNPFEFKKAASKEVTPLSFPKAHSELLLRRKHLSTQKPQPAQWHSLAEHHEPEQSTSTATASPIADNLLDSTQSSSSSNGTSSGTVTGGKRKRAAQDDGRQKSKKKRLTHAHCQLMGYMGECLRSTNRFYNIGFSVDHSSMSITYLDRMIGLRSASFNFLKDRTTFAAVMYAIHICDPQGMGFNSFLHATPFPALKSEPIQQMEGAFFHFPIRACSRINSNQPTSEMLTEPRSYITFQVRQVILEPRGYTGRVTAVYRVIATLPNGVILELALKTSWQVEDDIRRPEAELIEGLVEKLPAKFRKHLPTVHFSDKYTSDDAELNLPSRDLGFRKDMEDLNLWALDLRGYQILASKLYSRLIDASGPAQFIKVWIDCVKCHYVAYSTGKVLHRDLSENNLMIDWCPDDNGKMEATGVLNDWDMASRLDDALQVPRSSAAHRTGTLPFMSIQLLTHGEENEVRHRYRHDLESFFYILLWAVLFYDLKTHKMLRVPDAEDDIRKLRDWRGDDIEHSTNFKRNLFATPGFYNGLIEDALKGRQGWIPFVNKYLNPIQDLLCRLYGYLQSTRTLSRPIAGEADIGSGDDTEMEDDAEDDDEVDKEEEEEQEDPAVRAEREEEMLDNMFNYSLFMKAIKRNSS